MELGLIVFILSLSSTSAPLIPAITAAWPVIEVALPVAMALVKKGVPLVEAFAKAHPDLLATIKGIIAEALHGDANRADEITDDQVIALARPLVGMPWTKLDVDRWLAKPSAVD